MRRVMLLVLLALALPTAVLASSFPITVINDSFEIAPDGLPVGPGGHGLPNGCGTGCHFNNPGSAIFGWTTTGATGQHQWGTQDGFFHFFDKLPHGDSITSAYLNGGTISQTVGPTVQDGVSYILTLEIGHNKQQALIGSADLLVGGHMFEAKGKMPIPGHFELFTAKFTGTPQEVGDHITIQLKAAGSQGVFDSVHLTCSAPGCNGAHVPEPSMFIMLGAGLLPVFGMVRRRYLNR